MKRFVIFLLSLILITVSAEESPLLPDPVDFSASEEAVRELMTAAPVNNETQVLPHSGEEPSAYDEAISVDGKPIILDQSPDGVHIKENDNLSEPSIDLQPSPDALVTPEPTDVPLTVYDLLRADEPLFTPDVSIFLTPEPDAEPTAMPIMFSVTSRFTQTSLTYAFTPIGEPPP